MARGSGTSLSGGSLPVEGGIVIALNRLNRILRLDPDERIAVVEPGVDQPRTSRAAAAPHGLHYAPDPSSQSICTIGGNVAFNSGGAHCLQVRDDRQPRARHQGRARRRRGRRAGATSAERVGPDWAGLFIG